MLPSSKIELAIYEYAKQVSGERSTTIADLAKAVDATNEDVADRLLYLHSSGHITLGKYYGTARLEFSEKGSILYSAREFLFNGDFLVGITPSGRKYFEDLQEQAQATRSHDGTGKGIAMPKTKELTFETAFHSYRSEGDPRHGGAGTVFKVRGDDGEVYAIKRIDPGKATTDRNKRFKNELDYCKKETHRNIVKVVDDGFTIENGEKCPFYVMPFYPSTLRNMMKKGIPHEKALTFFTQVMDGVEAAHLRGVWHRDLKPENILHDPATHTLVVADFGIAHFEQEDLYTAVETKDGQRLANFQYAAPEQRMRGMAIDRRADIYALGLILNEMFTGVILQGAGYKRIASAAPQSQFLDEIVEAMAQQDSERRPGSIEEIKKLLRERGDQFVSEQKLSELRNAVIPASQIDDPLIDDPIRLVSFDVENESLVLKLSRPVNQAWIRSFQEPRSGTFFPGKEAGAFAFANNEATIRISPLAEHQIQTLVNFFKSYLDAANKAYAERARQDQMKREEEQRRRLREKIEAEERRQRILKAVKI